MRTYQIGAKAVIGRHRGTVEAIEGHFVTLRQAGGQAVRVHVDPAPEVEAPDPEPAGEPEEAAPAPDGEAELPGEVADLV